MKPALSRFLTVLTLILMLIGVLLIAAKGTSRAHFYLPDDHAVRVILSPTAAPSPTPDALTQFRTAREAAFEDTRSVLTQLISSLPEEDELHALAASRLQTSLEDEHLTLLIESALQGMGYPRAVCAVQDSAVTVFFEHAPDAHDGAMLCDLIHEWINLPDASVRLVHGL